MAVTNWYPGITLSIDPGAKLDYSLDFTEWLEGGSIAGVTISWENCTTGAPATTGNTVKVRVSGVSGKASVTFRVTATDGQVDDFTIRFLPIQK